MTLEIKNISKSFDKNQVLDQINFNLVKGEMVALIGRNGSGKTTILNIISDILRPDRGEVLIDQKSINKNPSLKENIAYLPDRFNYFKYLNPTEIKKYYRLIYPKFDQDFYHRELARLEIDTKKGIRTLSKGNLTLLGLITILSTGADYILLDEVLDGIDVINKRAIMEYLLDAVENKRGVLISSHQIKELEGIVDRGLYLGLNGRLEEAGHIEEAMKKYQIVTEDIIDQDLVQGFKISSNLARVYVIISRLDIEEIKEKNPHMKIIQYDQLDFKYEDIFQMEKEGEL